MLLTRAFFAAVLIFGLLGPASASAERVNYKITTAGHHYDTRISAGGFADLMTGRGDDAGNMFTYGVEGIYQNHGGIIRGVFMDGRFGLAMGGSSGFGLNLRGRVGLGTRRWTSGTHSVTVHSETRGNMIYKKILKVDYLPKMVERAWIAGVELTYFGGEENGKLPYVASLDFGQHRAFSTDTRIYVDGYGDKSPFAALTSIDMVLALESSIAAADKAGKDLSQLGGALKIDIDVRWRYLYMRMPIHFSSIRGASIALAFGWNMSQNWRKPVEPWDDFLTGDERVTSAPAGAPPPSVPAPEPEAAKPAMPTPPKDTLPAKPAPAPAPNVSGEE